MIKGREVITSRQFWKDKPTKRKLYDGNKFNEALQDVKELLDKEGIKFFLFYGTLVGAIREQDFILYDDDIDVGIYAEDAKRLLKCLSKMKDKGYAICGAQLAADEVPTYLYVAKDGVKLDLNSLFLFEKKRWFLRFSNEKIYGLSYDEKFFQTLDTIEFKGAAYNIPHDSEELLGEMWGTKPPDMAWWIATGGGQFGHKFTKTTTFTRETFKPEFLW